MCEAAQWYEPAFMKRFSENVPIEHLLSFSQGGGIPPGFSSALITTPIAITSIGAAVTFILRCALDSSALPRMWAADGCQPT